MRVTLVNEGTYPMVRGGVSVWCDQLVRGLAEHEFDLVTLVARGDEPAQWELPGNVSGTRPVALWAPPPPAAGRSRLVDQVRIALDALATAVAAEHEPVFGQALRALVWTADQARSPAHWHALLRAGRLPTALLASAGRGDPAGVRITAADAIAAAELVERSLLVLHTDPGEVDLVHAVANGPAAMVGLAASWRRGTPYFMSEHGVYLRERYLAVRELDLGAGTRRLVLAFLRLLSRACYAGAALVLPVSGFNKRWALWHGADPERVRTIYNGVDEASFPPLAAEPAEQAICWVGRIDPLKDLETLISAFAVVRKGEPAASLRLYGPCPAGNETYRDRCVALVTRLGLGDAVRFEGTVPRSRDAFGNGRLVALSSVSEGLPFTVLEAMMCGRATVNTDVGGVREAVGRAGVVVPPRDPRAFGDECLRLLRDQRHRCGLGAAARARALELFTLDGCLRGYRAAYQSAR